MAVRRKGKCEVLHLGRNKSSYQDTRRANQLKSSFSKKDRGSSVDSKQTISQTSHKPKCNLTAKAANSIVD